LDSERILFLTTAVKDFDMEGSVV